MTVEQFAHQRKTFIGGKKVGATSNARSLRLNHQMAIQINRSYKKLGSESLKI